MILYYKILIIHISSTLGGLRPRRSTVSRENMNNQDGSNDIVLQNIAKQISSKIDTNFINANQDLAPEIYSILKYNSKDDYVNIRD